MRVTILCIMTPIVLTISACSEKNYDVSADKGKDQNLNEDTHNWDKLLGYISMDYPFGATPSAIEKFSRRYGVFFSIVTSQELSDLLKKYREYAIIYGPGGSENIIEPSNFSASQFPYYLLGQFVRKDPEISNRLYSVIVEFREEPLAGREIDIALFETAYIGRGDQVLRVIGLSKESAQALKDNNLDIVITAVRMK